MKTLQMGPIWAFYVLKRFGWRRGLGKRQPLPLTAKINLAEIEKPPFWSSTFIKWRLQEHCFLHPHHFLEVPISETHFLLLATSDTRSVETGTPVDEGKNSDLDHVVPQFEHQLLHWPNLWNLGPQVQIHPCP